MLTRFQKGFQVVLIQVDNCEIRHRTTQRFVVVDLIFYFKPDIALIYPLTSITLPYGGLGGWTHLKLPINLLMGASPLALDKSICFTIQAAKNGIALVWVKKTQQGCHKLPPIMELNDQGLNH